jgi:hypothetical protein
MELSQQSQAMPQEEASRSFLHSARNFMSEIYNNVGARRAFAAGVLLAGSGFGFAEASTSAGAETQVAAVTAGAKPITSADKLPNGVTLNFPGSEKVYASTSESHSTVTASDVAKGKITILSYLNANGVPKKEITTANCFWSENGGWNTARTIYSPGHPTEKQVDWYKDNRPTYVCKTDASPSGWEKAGNHGPHGTIIDNCGNYFIPFGKPPEHVTIVNTPVILEKQFSDKIDISVKATALAIGRDQFGKICGEASASADASEEVTVDGYLKSGEGSGNDAVKEYDSVTHELRVEAKAHVDCGDTIIIVEEQTPTTTTRPATTTTTRPATTTTTRPATTTTTRPATTTTTIPPIRKAEVSVVKTTEKPNGADMHTPSDVFRFKEVCQDGKKIVERKVIYNDKHDRLVQPLGECNVGSIVDVTELTPLHQNRQEWVNVKKPTQYKVVGPNGDIFYFTDREKQKKEHPPVTTTTVPATTTTTVPATTTTTVPATTTTTVPKTTTTTVPETTTTTTIPENYLSVSMEQQTPAFEGDYVGVPFQVCADGSSSIRGDKLTYTFNTDPQGELTMQGNMYPNPQNPSGSECAMFEAAEPYPNDYVDVTLSDSDGLTPVYASTGTFPDRQQQ